MTRKTQPASETRRFTVHDAIVPHLIASQSGTVPKAIAELVMNSVDAGASRCDIEVSERKFTVHDNGAGFRSRDEVLRNFEKFGQPHSAGDATFGVFRIGRGQIFSLAHTFYESGRFRMEVNFRETGAAYTLTENISPEIAGCRIQGTFYHPMDAYQLRLTWRQMERAMQYVPLDVHLNGHLINTRPQSRKDWNIDDTDVYIRFTAGGGVHVYNMGIYVQTIAEEVYGCSGIVVTKAALPLNMARNDVLQSESPAWQRITEHLFAQGQKNIATTRRLSEGQRRNCIYRFLAGGMPSLEFAERKVFIDANNHHHNLRNFIHSRKYLSSEPLGGSNVASRVMDARPVIVLSSRTLEEFDAENAIDLLEEIAERMTDEEAALSRRKKGVEERASHDALLELMMGLENIAVMEFGPLAANLDDSYKEIDPQTLTPRLQASLEALQAGSKTIHRVLRSRMDTGGKARKIIPAVSSGPLAWTNGADRIYVSKALLSKFDNGLDHAHGVAAILVHEYLHDESDSDSHMHSPEFYAAYHDLVSDPKSQVLQKAARSMSWEYAKRLTHRRIMPNPIYRHYADPETFADTEYETTDVRFLLKGKSNLSDNSVKSFAERLDPLSRIVVTSLTQAFPYDTFAAAYPLPQQDLTIYILAMSGFIPWSTRHYFADQVLLLAEQAGLKIDSQEYFDDRDGHNRLRRLLHESLPDENPEIMDAVWSVIVDNNPAKTTHSLLCLLPSANQSPIVAVCSGSFFAEKGYRRYTESKSPVNLERFALRCDPSGRLPAPERARELVQLLRNVLLRQEDREWFAREFLNDRAARSLLSPSPERPIVEERACARKKGSLRVEVLEPANVGMNDLKLRDISQTGAFVLLPLSRPRSVLDGATLSLRIHDTARDESGWTTLAQVVRVTAEGMALKFTN